MCCFSQRVRHVSRTRIFARPLAPRSGQPHQLLAYAMSLSATADLAMVLPIPVPPGSADDAVRFVDMSACPGFFGLLDRLFPEEELSRGYGAPQAAPAGMQTLVVHDVGDFEASFVPRAADFDRLDERFRLPETVWEAPELAGYRDWGCCVFKLKVAPPPPAGLVDRVRQIFGAPDPSPPRDYHPMAFEFPRRDGSRLFFPTVHVHDGAVHPTAHFDHTLYCQADAGAAEGWERSKLLPGPSIAPALPWLDAAREVQRRRLVGDMPNEDVWAAATS